MHILKQEIALYENFNELAQDVLDLAQTILPNKAIYINYLNQNQQITLKISNHNTRVSLREGMTIQVDKGLCHMVDFENNKPLIYEDIQQVEHLDALKDSFAKANINAYMGIPITLDDGETFGTLCSADSQAAHFDERSVELLQKIARMFSYYLDMERLAFKDPLTGIYNRQFIKSYFKRIKNQKGTLLLLDLDGFKRVNDTLGHEAGDDVLVETAEKLMLSTQNDHELVARLGGDEFIVYLPDDISFSNVKSRAESLIKRFQTWATDVKDNQLTVSIGGYIHHQDENISLKDRLKNADSYLYKAKKHGKNTFHIE